MHKKLALTFIGFALIPLAIVIQLLLAYINKNHAHTRAEDVAKIITSELNYRLNERLRDIQTIALSPAFVQGERSIPESYCNKIVASHPDYKLVMRVDSEGVVDAVNTKDSKGQDISTQALIGKSFERSSWFQRALNSPEPGMETAKELDFIKALYGEQSFKVVPFSAAIQDGEGKTTGVWVTFVSLDFIGQLFKSKLQDYIDLAQIDITDKSGQLISQYVAEGLKSQNLAETGVEILNMAGQDWYVKAQMIEEDRWAYLQEYLWPLLVFIGMIIMYAFVAARRFIMPWQKLVEIGNLMAQGKTKADVPYQNRKDEVGQLARVLVCLKPAPKGQVLGDAKAGGRVQETAEKLEKTAKLVSGLSAQANILALNASMEAVNAHHLDEVAETANELAQRTSYNSQELLRKLSEIKSLCDEIQTNKTA